jgi:hypothetical protein
MNGLNLALEYRVFGPTPAISIDSANMSKCIYDDILKEPKFVPRVKYGSTKWYANLRRK